MTDVLAQMNGYVAAVTVAGVRCVLDGRDVNPPSLLIRPPTLSYRFGRGCVGATWAAWLYVPDAGQIDALRTALPLLDKIHDALATQGVALSTATPSDFQTPDGATVPGFVITWNTSQ